MTKTGNNANRLYRMVRATAVAMRKEFSKLFPETAANFGAEIAIMPAKLGSRSSVSSVGEYCREDILNRGSIHGDAITTSERARKAFERMPHDGRALNDVYAYDKVWNRDCWMTFVGYVDNFEVSYSSALPDLKFTIMVSMVVVDGGDDVPDDAFREVYDAGLEAAKCYIKDELELVL